VALVDIAVEKRLRHIDEQGLVKFDVGSPRAVPSLTMAEVLRVIWGKQEADYFRGRSFLMCAVGQISAPEDFAPTKAFG
jgi:hypothetical protein